MLPYGAIRDAAASLLERRFPGTTIYKDWCEMDFERPSLLVTIGAPSLSDEACDLVSLTVPLIITYFPPVDGYGHSSSDELLCKMQDIQAAFAQSSLEVSVDGDRRALHVDGNVGEYGADYTEVTITLSYVDDRPSARVPAPLMESAEIEIKV